MSDYLTHFAKQLRKNAPDVEHILWRHLRRRQCGGYKFRRQHPIGKYIVDFVCIEKKLVIELDGSQHTESTEKDRARDSWLNNQGYRVLRFWDNEVIENVEGVCDRIQDIIEPFSSMERRG